MKKLILLVLFLCSLLYADNKFNKLIEKGEYSKAIEYAEKKVPENERDHELWYDLGYANEKQGNNERALACYFSSNRKNENIKAFIGIARVYNNLGHYAQAVILAHKATLKAPQSMEAKWEFVKANFNLKRWAGMDALLYDIIEKDDSNYEAKKYLGLYLYKVENFGKARLLLNDYLSNLKNKDNDLDVVYKVAFCFFKSGQYLDAVEYCKIILSKESKNDEARLLLARIYFNDAKYGLALNEYKQINNKDSIKDHDYYNIAISNDKNGNSEDALKNFNIFINRSENQDEKVLNAQLYVGSIYLKRKEYKRALQYFEAVMIRNSNLAGLNINMAKCYAEIGDIDKAISFAKNELVKDSNSVKSYITLIEMYEKKNIKTKAQEVRVQMEEKCPNSAQMHFEIGQYFLSQLKYADALKSYEKSFVLKESNSALEGIAFSAFYLKKYEKARGAAESILRTEQSTIAWEVLARISIEDKKYKEALDYLDNLSQRASKIEYYKMMAFCYEKTGDLKKLYLSDEKILSIKPNDTVSLERLAFAKAKENKHSEALELLIRIDSLNASNEKIYFQMYKSAEALKKLDDAVVYLKKYISIVPEDLNAQKFIADIYYLNQDYDKAYYWYKKLDGKKINGFYLNYAKIVISKANVDEIIKVCKRAINNNEIDEYIYSNLGKIYKRIKAFKEAENAFSAALKINPKSVNDLLELSECQMELKLYKDAIVSYEQVILLKKDPSDELKILGSLYEKIDNMDGAIRAYKKYLQYSKPIDLVLKVADYEYSKENFKDAKKYYEFIDIEHSFDVLFKYGKSCYNEKNWDKALGAYIKIEQKYSKQIKFEIYLHMAICYEKSKDIKNSIKYYQLYSDSKPEQDIVFKMACLQEGLDKKIAKKMFEKNTQLFPEDYKSYAKLGHICFELNDFKGARRAFEKVVTLADTVDLGVWLSLGDIYRSSKEREKEKNVYIELLKKEPQNFEANKRLGTMLYEDGKEKNALIFLELARSQNYNDPDILFVLSHIYFKDGRHQEALLMLNTAKKIKPSDCNIRHYLLNVHIDLSKWFEARREVEELLKYEHTKENLIIYAEILVQLKRYDFAEKILKEMKEKEPTNIDILLYLAYVYRLGKKYDDAMEVHKKISYINDQHIYSILERAELYVLIGNPDQAIVFYERAIKLDSKNVNAELGIAKVYKFIGKNDLYKKHIDRAYELDPKNQEVIKEREYVQLKM